MAPSFGFGDRIGLATPGHVAAMKAAGGDIAPIFPQQSIREMTRTSRSPAQVMGDALEGARAAGWGGPIGADADHLKTPADVDATAAAGFTYFTIDPSGFVDPQADSYSLEQLGEKAAALRDEVGWLESYRGKSIRLPSGSRVDLDQAACLRAAVKYGRAINHAVALADHIRAVNAAADRDYEIELSIDETPQPTTLAEHYIIADQCLAREMKLVSLAPRFIGEFEKGVDYKGDLPKLEASLADHAAIAELLGPYKLSLHSGSDKFSIYPALVRQTRGLAHLKTAGTSYLVALRTVATLDADLFREIYAFALGRYEKDRASYHVSARAGRAPSPGDVGAAELPGLLEHFDAREILHVTFGSVLGETHFRDHFFELLRGHPERYAADLEAHLVEHLRPFVTRGAA
jgi:hypothetical protein